MHIHDPQYGVISYYRRMSAVQSGSQELGSGSCSHALTCTKMIDRMHLFNVPEHIIGDVT